MSCLIIGSYSIYATSKYHCRFLLTYCEYIHSLSIFFFWSFQFRPNFLEKSLAVISWAEVRTGAHTSFPHPCSGRVCFASATCATKGILHAWSIIQNLFAKLFSQMDVTFRDESNEPSSTVIDYSNATVPSSNHAVKDLIRFVSRSSARVV